MDVICFNRYYGWYSDTGHTEVIKLQLSSNMQNWHKAFPTKPLIITEYGADTIPGLHTVSSPNCMDSQSERIPGCQSFQRLSQSASELVYRAKQTNKQSSGLNINVDKTKAVWIGSRRNSKLRFMPEINLDWNPVTFTVLGVVFSTDVLEIVTINFENKLNEMKKVLNAWSRRNLTPFGRITVIKSLVISKITHLLMNLPDPEESFLKELNTLLYNFLWNGKNDKIRRSGVCQAYEIGGLKMVDIKSFLAALKISWLKRMLHDDGKLSKILQAMCPLIQNVKQRGGEFANIIMQRVKNPFWFDVFKHYKKISAKCTPVTFMILCQNVYIIMLIYAEEKGLYVLEIGWTVALFPWDILLVHMDTYHIMNSRQNFPMLGLIFCCMKGY